MKRPDLVLVVSVDAYWEVGSQLDQQGEWDESAEVYSELISSLPDADDRAIFARHRLESVNQKRAANNPGQSDAPEPK